jgi:hypothetical protein
MLKAIFFMDYMKLLKRMDPGAAFLLLFGYFCISSN